MFLFLYNNFVFPSYCQKYYGSRRQVLDDLLGVNGLTNTSSEEHDDIRCILRYITVWWGKAFPATGHLRHVD